MNTLYYIIWIKDAGENWQAVEITNDVEVVSEFITETTYLAIVIEQMDLRDRIFPVTEMYGN